MDISKLLTFGVEQGASDLHLSAGVEPMIRVDGDMRRLTHAEKRSTARHLRTLKRPYSRRR